MKRNRLLFIFVIFILSFSLASCNNGELNQTNELVVLSSGSIRMEYIGESKTLEVKTNIVGNVLWTWSSSNPAVASVDRYGTVTALSVGSAVVSVSSENGTKAYCVVDVVGKTLGIEDVFDLKIDNLTQKVQHIDKTTNEVLSEYIIDGFYINSVRDDGRFVVAVVFRGTKTYDVSGDNGTHPIILTFSLYDEKGTFCEKQTVKLGHPVKVGEEFEIT
ncbi:MAG: Ig-like domain-containing protein, partial [Clostridia bacterium]|nr:Ig-like domain-containing protein [Clostridia bacterium]